MPELNISRNDVVLWALRVILLLIIFLPIYNAFLISFRSLGTLGQHQLLPRIFQLDNYIFIISDQLRMRQLFNSIMYSSVVTIFNLLLTVPAAYAVTRFEFRGRGVFLFTLLLTQMFAAIVIVPGLYNLVLRVNIHDTYFALIVSMTAITFVLSTWMLMSFFESIDVAIEEAAMIDGCSRTKIIREIIIPLSKPGIVTAATFVFIQTYSQFLIPLILLNSREKYPVTVAIYDMFGVFPTHYPRIMAYTIISLLPIFFIYFTLQKYIVEGLTSGGLKG